METFSSSTVLERYRHRHQRKGSTGVVRSVSPHTPGRWVARGLRHLTGTNDQTVFSVLVRPVAPVRRALSVPRGAPSFLTVMTIHFPSRVRRKGGRGRLDPVEILSTQPHGVRQDGLVHRPRTSSSYTSDVRSTTFNTLYLPLLPFFYTPHKPIRDLFVSQSILFLSSHTGRTQGPPSEVGLRS